MMTTDDRDKDSIERDEARIDGGFASLRANLLGAERVMARAREGGDSGEAGPPERGRLFAELGDIKDWRSNNALGTME